MAHECYLSGLEIVREELVLVDAHSSEVRKTDFKGWDPGLGSKVE